MKKGDTITLIKTSNVGSKGHPVEKGADLVIGKDVGAGEARGLVKADRAVLSAEIDVDAGASSNELPPGVQDAQSESTSAVAAEKDKA